MQQKLMEYYEEQQKKLFTWSIVVWILMTVFMAWLEVVLRVEISKLTSSEIVKEALKILLALVTPTTIVWLTYSYILKIVDTKWWKRKYPQYDISGKWQDITTYEQALDSNGWKKIQIPPKPSTVIFEQTCRHLKILPSDGKGFSWGSIAIYWDNQEDLHILYQVRYKSVTQQQNYPERRIGYELMHIDRTELSEKQKPHKMRGQFWHCIAQDGKPMYLGDVVYERM